jgi:hypothetical protein
MMNNAVSRARRQRWANVLVGVSCLALCVAVYGAIPYLSTEAVGQMLWTSGFAQSFANQGWLSIYAHDFGMPAPSPMAFGLAGGLLESVILRLLPLSAVDAYSLMIDLYLALAFWSAAMFAGRLGVTGTLRFVGATIWLCLPMVWTHAGYSMLSLGFALLPCYLLCAMRLIDELSELPRKAWPVPISGFVGAALLAVFMDGYTFVFFLVSAGFYWAHAFVWRPATRRRLFLVVLPILGFGFALATVLYVKYEGVHHFDSSPIDFFRAFGADVTLFVQPDLGTLWFWDKLGLSVDHNPDKLFGDASIWNSTFCLPLVLAAAVGAWLERRRPQVWFFFAVAAFGFYFGLGPSLKVASVRPPQEIAGLMDARFALGSTGSGWISRHIPGFDSMRASYRWVGLGMLALWALALLWLKRVQLRSPPLTYLIAAGLLLLVCLPDIPGRIASGVVGRQGFFAMKRDIADPLAASLKDHRRVAFLPRGNDFLANYLAAFYAYDTYNVGGDKNVAIAARQWDADFLGLTADAETPTFVDDMRSLLGRGAVDAEILPYVDLLLHAHTWPPAAEDIAKFRRQAALMLGCIGNDSDFSISDNRLYAIVTLSTQGRAAIREHGLESWIAEKPICPRLPPFAWPDIASDKFGHQVGKLDTTTGQFMTDGRGGYLVFGPYASLAPGDYVLELSGKLEGQHGNVDIDVVANSNTVTLVRASRNDLSNGKDPLLRIPFHVARNMRRIETRIWVAPETGFALSALKVHPAESATESQTNR